MTCLETILIAIIWIAYGAFNANQMTKDISELEDICGYWFTSIVLAPLFLIGRAIYGIFKNSY